MSTRFKKIVLFAVLACLVAAFFLLDLNRYFTLDYIKQSRESFAAFYAQNRILTIAVYMLLYIAITALSLPGATVMTLVGGALFAEIIFSYPGLGTTLLNGVMGQDYPLISASTMLVTIMVLSATFIIEIVYGIIDPRIKAAYAD